MRRDVDVSIMTDETIQVVSITTIGGQDSVHSGGSASGRCISSGIKHQEFRS